MTRRIVLCLSHSIEEHDQLRLLHSIGHEVFSIGGYINPAQPHDPKRPALPQVPHYPELQAAVDALGTDDNLRAAQERIPDAILDWADTIIYHHYLDHLWWQWDRIADWKAGDPNRRVIWRTVGQSVDGNEFTARPFRAQGLEIVRYSPKERNIPHFAGEDALIRFYKDPAEWSGWTGEWDGVINVTQHLRQREPYTNWGFWEQATQGLNRMPLGPGSEVIGGPGELTYDEMKAWLRKGRVYLYTGTQPASYTLGLIEAMMTGIPVVSIGPSWMQIFPYGHLLFEGHEIVDGSLKWSDDPAEINHILRAWYLDRDSTEGIPQDDSEGTRERAIELFGMDTIAEQWRAFLA